MRPIRGLEFTTGEHGYESLSVFVPMSLQEAFYLLDRPGLPQVFVKSNAITVWQGRLEDLHIVAGGIELGALGDWRGYSDVPYDKGIAGAEGEAEHLSVTGLTIVRDLVAKVNSVNSFMSASTGLIDDPGVTLVKEHYQDRYASDILNRLAQQGDNQSPVRVWEAGVWDDRVLHFRAQASAGRTWHVDALEIDLERTIATLWNSAYGLYQDPANQRRVTAVSTDAPSVDRWGVTRRAPVSIQTTETARAEKARDLFVQDNKDPKPRASIPFTRLFDAYGTAWPNWAAKAGDKFFLRNLPTTLSADIDRIRSFRCSHTKYQADGDRIEATPELSLPSVSRPDIPGTVGTPPTIPTSPG
jgi:hypothetical protein